MMTVTKRLAGAAVIAAAAAVSNPATAQTRCGMTDFTIHAVRTGNLYVSGSFDGTYKRIIICKSDGTCDNRTSDQRLSLAISAQMAGKPLWFFIQDYATCAEVPDWYVTPHEVLMEP